MGRQLAAALFADLITSRRRTVMSVVAHYIAGVLDRESMIEIVESVSQSAEFQPGVAVKKLRGSTEGVIVRLLPDGRVEWRPSGSETSLIALPESLVPA